MCTAGDDNRLVLTASGKKSVNFDFSILVYFDSPNRKIGRGLESQTDTSPPAGENRDMNILANLNGLAYFS